MKVDVIERKTLVIVVRPNRPVFWMSHPAAAARLDPRVGLNQKRRRPKGDRQ
jgi:hypothetical protein